MQWQRSGDCAVPLILWSLSRACKSTRVCISIGSSKFAARLLYVRTLFCVSDPRARDAHTHDHTCWTTKVGRPNACTAGLSYRFLAHLLSICTVIASNMQTFQANVEARLERLRLLMERLRKEEAKDKRTQLGLQVGMCGVSLLL